jgi:hypothetical protein
MTTKKLAVVSAVDQQQVINHVYELAKTNPEGALQYVKDAEGETISWEASKQLQQSLVKANDDMKLLNSGSVRESLSRFEKGLKVQTFVKQNILEEDLEQFVSNSNAVFQENVASAIQGLDKSLPDFERERLLQKMLPSIQEKTTKEILKEPNDKTLKKQAYLSSRMANEIKTGATDPKVNPVAEWTISSLVFPSYNPNPTELLLSRLGRLEQLQNQLDVTAEKTKLEGFKPEQALKEQNELKQFMANKSQTYLTEVANIIKAGGSEVSRVFGDENNSEFYTNTPEQAEKYNADYFKIKSRIGFSSTELSSGITSDGIKFDPKTLSTDSTLFFKSTAEARKAFDDYKNAIKTDANGFTTFDGSAQGYYIQTLVDLYGIKDEDALTAFMSNQKLKLQLLGK